MDACSRLLVGLALALCSTFASAEWFVVGRVVAIADGDTVTLLDDTKTQHKIRLAGIDAPESRQAFGTRAKQRLGQLLHERRVEARCHKRDRYKREICTLFANGQDVGLQMVREGMAWWYREYAKEQATQARKLYESAENTARSTRVGLWSEPQPVPPWQWRRDKRKSHPAMWSNDPAFTEILQSMGPVRRYC